MKKHVNRNHLLNAVSQVAEEEKKLLQRLLQEPAIESVVKSVLKRKVDIVMPKVEKTEVKILFVKPTEKKSLRGQNRNKRWSYSAKWKLEVIQESRSRQNNDEIAQKYSINWKLVIKLVKGKNKIAPATESEIKKHLKIKPARKYKGLCVELLKLFKEAWEKRNWTGFSWV